MSKINKWSKAKEKHFAELVIKKAMGLASKAEIKQIDALQSKRRK